ncbi:hypothetical protein GCM10009527_001520 [Actinomadura nitritigenes]
MTGRAAPGTSAATRRSAAVRPRRAAAEWVGCSLSLPRASVSNRSHQPVSVSVSSALTRTVGASDRSTGTSSAIAAEYAVPPGPAAPVGHGSAAARRSPNGSSSTSRSGPCTQAAASPARSRTSGGSSDSAVPAASARSSRFMMDRATEVLVRL